MIADANKQVQPTRKGQIVDHLLGKYKNKTVFVKETEEFQQT